MSRVTDEIPPPAEATAPMNHWRNSEEEMALLGCVCARVTDEHIDPLRRMASIKGRNVSMTLGGGKGIEVLVRRYVMRMWTER